jgi:hypothetical protein
MAGALAAAVAPSAAAAIFDRDVMRGSLGKDVEWDVGPQSRAVAAAEYARGDWGVKETIR